MPGLVVVGDSEANVTVAKTMRLESGGWCGVSVNPRL